MVKIVETTIFENGLIVYLDGKQSVVLNGYCEVKKTKENHIVIYEDDIYVDMFPNSLIEKIEINQAEKSVYIQTYKVMAYIEGDILISILKLIGQDLSKTNLEYLKKHYYVLYVNNFGDYGNNVFKIRCSSNDVRHNKTYLKKVYDNIFIPFEVIDLLRYSYKTLYLSR